MAFAVGSRLGGSAPGWLARAGFVAVASVATALVYWTYHRLDQTTTTLVVISLLVCGGAVAFSVDGLIENNAPPTPRIRDEILGHHANLAYPREPQGKRALDIVAASVGIVVTLPLWFVVALLIWFNEPGPIFFTKNSVGRGGITFRELKFRSMRYGAERNTGPVVATFEDPRTLAVGGPLRQWHLDELPELLNVLTGTMSVVGPRPLRALVVRRDLREVPGFAERHTVRPGIACIAQIEKCHVPAAERLAKDLIYIRGMSLGYDLRLLVRAVVTTVRGKREPAPLPGDVTRPIRACSDTASDSQPMQVLAAKERTAFHESGHALVGMVTPGADPIPTMSLVSHDQPPVGTAADGRTLDQSDSPTTRLRARIMGALGGLAAEEIVYGDTTAGAECDLHDVIDMAREIVSRRDTAESVRPVEAPSSTVPEPYSSNELPPGLTDTGDSTLADDEVLELVDECYAQAMATLRDRREHLEHLAYALLERETLDADEAYAAAGVAREPEPAVLDHGEPARPR
jgi:lipopolysaccharide/colanic/teichoic acid biosynthesis glycosyltransferase